MAQAAVAPKPAGPPPRPAAPPAPPLPPDAAARLHDLKLAEERFKKYFRMRATEFIRGKGSLAVVNDPVCMGCTHCFDNCAFEAIDMVERKFTLPELTYTSRKAVIITENCVGCEKCAIVCPVDAITMVPKDGWDVRDGRLVQVEAPPSLEKPYLQPPKPGEPRPPVEAAPFVAFREEGKKAAAAAPKPAPAPAKPATPTATPAKPAAPPSTPASAPSPPEAEAPGAPTPPPKPAPAPAASGKALTPEDIRKMREEARKKALEAKAEERKE